MAVVIGFLRRYFIDETIIILRERKIWINAKETQRRSCSEKERMEQSFVCASGNGDSYITFVRLWRQKCGKRRYRNNYGVLMEHKPV